MRNYLPVLRQDFMEIKALLRGHHFQRLKISDRTYRLLSACFLLALFIFIPALSFQFGITWDERMSITYSNDVISYFRSFGSDRRCLDTGIRIYNHLIYYGNIFGLISSLLARISPFGIIETRHLLNSFFGCIAIFYTMRLAHLSGGPKLALLCGLLLLLSPRFLGHIMNDFRDTTFMTGYIAAIYYLTRTWMELPELKITNSTKLSLAIILASGVRIGGILLIFVFATVLFIYVILNIKHFKIKWLSGFIFHLLAVFFSVFFLTVLIWPWGQQNILINPLDALIKFSKLDLITSYQLFKGRLIPNSDVPWDYLFVWIGITTPILVLIGWMGLIIPFFKRRILKKRLILLPPFLAMALPIGLYLALPANLYDAWRHFLFLAPFLALFSGIGWSWAFYVLKQRITQTTALLTFTVLLALAVRGAIVIHPFQSVYFNELIGGIKGAYSNFELDIDGNSLRYGMEWLNGYGRKNHLRGIVLASNHDGLSLSHFADTGLIKGDVIWLPAISTFQLNWDYAILTSRTLSKHQLVSGQWPYKESIHELRIDGVPLVSVLKRQDKHVVYGKQALDEGKFTESAKEFEGALDFDNNNEEYWHLLALAYLSLDKFRQADSALDRALRLLPENPLALYYKGQIAYQLGHKDIALNYFHRSKQFREKNYRADYFIANIMVDRGNYTQAEQMFRVLAETKGISAYDYSLILNDYANLYMIMARSSYTNRIVMYNRAISLLEKSISLNPDLEVAYDNLIEIYSISGKKEYASGAYELKKQRFGDSK